MFALASFMILAHDCGLTSSLISVHQYQNLSEEKDIFILAGQSNMAGRGGVVNGTWDGFIPPECRPKPSIIRLPATLTWEEAHEPLHCDIDAGKPCGVGPGLAFLYNQLLKRAETALRDGGRIRALLWYQGESDTVNKSDAELYKMRLEEFFTDIRTDLGFPTLPIVQVALTSAEGPYFETVRKAQLGIDLPNVTCVDATSAQVHLGKMLADAFRHIAAPFGY